MIAPPNIPDNTSNRDRELRVTLCAAAYPPNILGGGEISTQVLAEALADSGVRVTVVTFTDEVDRVAYDIENDIAVVRIPHPNIYWSVRAHRQASWKKVLWHARDAIMPGVGKGIRSEILKSSPDLVHTSTIEDFGPGFWRWLSQTNVPTVHTIRSYTLLHRGATMYDVKRDCSIRPCMLSIPKRIYSQFLDGVIGISHHVLKTHTERGFFNGVEKVVIPNPVKLRPKLAEKEPGDCTQLGVLGRLSPEKGITAFLQAMGDLGKTSEWKLAIAGEGESKYVDRLKQIAACLPVEFLGWVDSRKFLEKLDMLVVPSRWHEPFGRIVVEAFSAGVPVLCLRRGGLPELIKSRTNGVVLNEWSTEGILSAIQWSRSTCRESIMDTAHPYSAQRVAQEHIGFYHRLLSKASANINCDGAPDSR